MVWGGVLPCSDNCLMIFTLPETNIALENRPSQKESSLATIHVQVQRGFVLGDFLRIVPW